MNLGLFSLCTACAFLAVAVGCAPTAITDQNAGPHDVTASAPGSAHCFDPNPAEQAIGLQVTNAARSRAGLPPVQADRVLAKAAAVHACDMAKRGTLTHAGSSSSGPSARIKRLGYAPRVTAENIAAGPYNAAQALAAWNGSSGHLQNIVIPQMRDFGVGSAIGSDGKTVYWAAVYAARR